MKRSRWFDLEKCTESKRIASAILREATMPPYVPVVTTPLPPMIPPDRLIESSKLTLAETNSGLQKRIDAAFDAEQKRTLSSSQLSWQNRLPGEDVLLPLQLVCERALDELAAESIRQVSNPTTTGDLARSLDAFDHVHTVELELITREWEESFMRPPDENESECSRGDDCWGVKLIEDNLIEAPLRATAYVLVQFATPNRKKRPDGLCVVCLRAHVSALFHEHVESGKPQSRVIQPYRVVVGPDNYDPRVCLSRNSHSRFMGITDPFPQFFVNSFRWTPTHLEQRDLNFNRVATKALRYSFETTWFQSDGSRRFSAAEFLGLPAETNLVRREAAERFASVENKLPIFGLYSFSSFWIPHDDLFSFCLTHDSRRASESFSTGTKRSKKKITVSRWSDSFRALMVGAHADPIMWVQMKQLVRLAFARYGATLDEFDRAVFEMVHSAKFLDWCCAHEKMMIAVVREYASHVLEYQGFSVSNANFWRQFSADSRRRMDEISDSVRAHFTKTRSLNFADDFMIPNYDFPQFKPWYWSFENFVGVHDPIEIDCRYLFDDEPEFFAQLGRFVSAETVQYFRDRRTDAVDDPEVNRVKSTLHTAFSVVSVRAPSHWSHTGRCIYLMCPKCRQWRTHVTPTIREKDNMSRRRKNAKKRKRKTVPMRKTMGARMTAYDVQLDRFVCLAKKSKCNFAQCVPIRFAGKIVDFFGVSTVRCPACERLMNLDPDNPTHAENEFHCGCLDAVARIEPTCHKCDATLNRRQMKPILVFGAGTDSYLCFCKDHSVPPWTGNRHAWHYRHLMACLDGD